MSKYIPCLTDELKQLISESTDSKKVHDALKTIETCPIKVGGRGRSAYQQFISECMQTKPIKGKPFGEAGKYMKECATQWRDRKGN